jgi:hypothetical protein
MQQDGVMAIVIYLLAGIGFCWSYHQDRWWQRLAMIPLWLPLILWGMFVEASDWWRESRYEYEVEQPKGEQEDEQP